MTSENHPSHYAQFEAIIRQIERLPYRKRRELMWHRARPRPTRYLYKFRALDPSNDKSVNRLRDIIVSSKFWLSSPDDFNDPFDMSAKMIAEGTIKQKQQRFRDILKLQSVKFKELHRKLPLLVAKDSVELAAVANKMLRNYTNAAGVYSFGGDPRSILMWSHYAANHEGICLQFERVADPRIFYQALPVEYSDEYPVVNWITEFKSGIQNILLRKHSGWKYEQESRIIFLGYTRRYEQYRPEALRGIIIGCRASSVTVHGLNKLIDERVSLGLPRPRLYRAYQHDTNYRLVIKKES